MPTYISRQTTNYAKLPKLILFGIKANMQLPAKQIMLSQTNKHYSYFSFMMNAKKRLESYISHLILKIMQYTIQFISVY